MSDLVNTDTMARMLGVDPETLRRMVRRDEVPVYLVNPKSKSSFRFDPDEVRAAIRLKNESRIVARKPQ